MGQSRHIATRALLQLARRTANPRATTLAQKAAGSDRAANEALYYVGVRYFGHDVQTLKDAVDIAQRANLNPAAVIQPLLVLEGVPRERRVQASLATIDGMLWYAAQQHDATHEHEIGVALDYARQMLLGEFARARRSWSSMRRTQHVLESLDDVATGYPASAMAEDFSEEATLAVILPGASTTADLEVIEQHRLIGRTSWDANRPVANGGASGVDLVFLNRDRYIALSKTESVEGEPLFVTKSCVEGKGEGSSVSSSRRVLFELFQPLIPAATTTYLPVTIALWAMATFSRPATFLCGDFYLGEKTYQSDTYDAKKHLASVNDVRWSYLAHDVFFVHAALSHWLAQGRIAAHGRLKELLEMSGSEFAQCMEERWGSTVLS